MSSNEPVTMAITRIVKPGCEEAFEKALHEFARESLSMQGQRGVHILRPPPGSGSREYGILRQFAGEEARDEFYRSKFYEDWKTKVRDWVEGEPRYEHLSGLETWFTLPGNRSIVPPPRWKMAVVTLIAVYPTSLLIGLTLARWIRGLPFFVTNLVIAAAIVATLTWVLMPTLTQLFRPWLYPGEARKLRRGD